MARWLALVALVAMVGVAAGCGGSKKSAAPATTAATTTTSSSSSSDTTSTDTTSTTTTGTDTTSTDTTSTTTTGTDTTSTSTTGSSGDHSVSASCLSFAQSASKLSEAFAQSTTGNFDSDKLKSYFDGLASKAPSSIKSAFQTVADAFGKYLDALKGANFKPGETPSADQLAKLQAASKDIDTPAVQAASNKIQAWVQAGCH